MSLGFNSASVTRPPEARLIAAAWLVSPVHSVRGNLPKASHFFTAWYVTSQAAASSFSPTISIALVMGFTTRRSIALVIGFTRRYYNHLL